jgi:predicted RNase H-like HicB family nuclease
VAGKLSATLKPKTESSILRQVGSTKGATVKGYAVVFEGDDESGYSAYSPDLPGVIAAGDSRQDTETLMIEAMAAHIAMLRQEGQPVPEPSEAASVTILDPAAA